GIAKLCNQTVVVSPRRTDFTASASLRHESPYGVATVDAFFCSQGNARWVKLSGNRQPESLHRGETSFICCASIDKNATRRRPGLQKISLLLKETGGGIGEQILGTCGVDFDAQTARPVAIEVERLENA